VVEGTEPKMRYVSTYKKLLEKSVTTSLLYINELVDNIPGSVDITHKNFALDPLVHAYFSSTKEIKEIFSNSKELKLFFDNGEDEQAYALLCMNHDDKTVLGMELQNDVLIRDVMQTAVNFSEHKVMSPTATEEETRGCIKKCIFDGLITYALKKLIELKSEYRELQEQQSSLQSRLRSRQAKEGGLNKLLISAHNADSEYKNILEKIEETKDKLKEVPPQWELPRYYIDQVNNLLEHPEEFIRLEPVRVNINNMGIKISDKSTEDSSLICLDELTIDNVLKRVVVIACYPRDEM
ncbi:MAG: hypothetical protein OEY78_12215, partial [Gammaproteobacteria bacterium]|nr:hypothetical protein [Gammaproteobacteria bacterium]